MKRPICPHCGCKYETKWNKGYPVYILCGEGYGNCYHDLGIYGDDERRKLWAAIWQIVNGRYPREDLEACSEAAPTLRWIEEVIESMDGKARMNFVLKLAKREVI